ncbi:asparaginyl-tRNA synthetase-like [Styela clava]
MSFIHVFRRLYSSATKVRIKNLSGIPSNTEVNINGWVKSVRNHKKVAFLDINDGSCIRNLQVVLSTGEFSTDQYFYGSALEITGELIHRQHKNPNMEILCKSIKQYGTCDPESYPLQSEYDHPLNYTRQFPHLRPRQNMTASILRVRNRVEMLIHDYFQKNDFTHIHTPIITSNDCEGAGALFSVTLDTDEKEKENFFGIPSYLTVSGQLHLEACSMGIGNVYTLSPAFRAEQSRPRTHVSEFHMLEIEMAFTKSMQDLLNILEDSLRHIIKKSLEECNNELSMFHQKADIPNYQTIVERCANESFLNIEYKDIVKLLQSNRDKLSTDIKWSDDLNIEHEKFITTYHGHRPVFVTNFPAKLKPFYALHNDDADGTSASFDLLFPHCGEMAGGTLREDRYDVLNQRLSSLGLENEYKWYSDLRKFGGVPHGGYGLGFDRLIRFLLGVNNIRDVIPFPRASHFCYL